MSSLSLPVNPKFSPFRRGLARLLTVLFVVALGSMLVLGTILVLLQLGGVLVADGDFVIAAEKALGPITYGVAAALGVLTLLVAEAYGWKSTD